MLAARGEVLQAAQLVDVGILLLGSFCAVALGGWLLREGRWRNPLGDLGPPVGGPGTRHVVFTVGLYILCAVLLGQVAGAFVDSASAAEPGTHAWHVFMGADHAARILAVALMIVLLSRHRSFRVAAPVSRRPFELMRTGLLGTLIIVPICTVQLQMGGIIWQWLNPAAPPPLHPVLVALEESAWGRWGTVQLFVFAVVVAPLAEELFFRGLLLQGLWKQTGLVWPSIVLSALAFGFIHGQPQDVLPLCTMGAALGYVRLRTRSLSVCVLIHALFNTRTMISAVFFPDLIPRG